MFRVLFLFSPINNHHQPENSKTLSMQTHKHIILPTRYEQGMRMGINVIGK